MRIILSPREWFPVIRQPLPDVPLRLDLTIAYMPALLSMDEYRRMLVIGPVVNAGEALKQRRAVQQALDVGFEHYKRCTLAIGKGQWVAVRSARIELVDERWVRPMPSHGYAVPAPRQIIRPTRSVGCHEKDDQLNFFARIAGATQLTFS